MLLQNVRYYGADCRFHTGSIETEGDRIVAVREHECCPTTQLLPGLVEIHFHGNSGADFSDGDYDGLVRMAAFHARHGVTSFAPASMTLPEETIAAAFRTAVRLRAEQPAQCARIRGINMEGPFFNEKKKGAQAAEHLRLPDPAMLRRLAAEADGLLRIVCVAPELDGAIDFIRAAAADYVVSVAHTAADYDAAAAGFDAGATHITHLFNAMPSLLHRDPGPIAAAAERPQVTAELICDGVHIHPAAVRAAFRLFGAERICLISDSMAACGMADGTYSLGGQKVTVRGNRATLDDGTIAGSVTPLYQCLLTALCFGIPAEDALRAATLNPARVLGVDHETGSIAVGKQADLLLTDPDFTLREVYIGGQPVLG